MEKRGGKPSFTVHLMQWLFDSLQGEFCSGSVWVAPPDHRIVPGRAMLSRDAFRLKPPEKKEPASVPPQVSDNIRTVEGGAARPTPPCYCGQPCTLKEAASRTKHRGRKFFVCHFEGNGYTVPTICVVRLKSGTLKECSVSLRRKMGST